MKPQYRYAHNAKNKTSGPGRRVDPNSWKYGPDEFTHESHYAYLKHRSQAQFRKESYELTFEQWHNLWTPETLAQRGRCADSLVLTRIDWGGEWSVDNVALVTRKQHLKMSGEFRKRTGRVRKKQSL
jgi:hypothetical protein